MWASLNCLADFLRPASRAAERKRAELQKVFKVSYVLEDDTLICAPFLEFRDRDEHDETRTTLVPVADEGFVFFYSDKKEAALERFRTWRESVLKVALKEVMQNL